MNLWTIQGLVEEVEMYSNTSGTYGNVSTTNWKKIYVVSSDGTENIINIDEDVAARKGHDVILVCENEKYRGLINRSTKQYFEIDKPNSWYLLIPGIFLEALTIAALKKPFLPLPAKYSAFALGLIGVCCIIFAIKQLYHWKNIEKYLVKLSHNHP